MESVITTNGTPVVAPAAWPVQVSLEHL